MKKTHLALLGLTKNEVDVLSCCIVVAQSAGSISLSTGISRSLVYSILERLTRRGVVQKKTLHRTKVWGIVSEGDLDTQIASLKVALIRSRQKSERPHPDVTVYIGKKEIKKYLESLFSFSTEGKLSILQSSNPSDGWLSLFGVSGINELNKKLRENKILFDSLMPADYFENLSPVLGKDWLHSYIERANLAYFLPESFTSSKAEFIIFLDRVVVLSLSDLLCTEFRNIEVRNMYIQIFSALKSQSKKADLQKLLLQ
jgi:hypothetical protein